MIIRKIERRVHSTVIVKSDSLVQSPPVGPHSFVMIGMDLLEGYRPTLFHVCIADASLGKHMAGEQRAR